MNLQFPSITIISARPNSGKSHFIKWCVREYAPKQIWDLIVVFTPTVEDYNYLPKTRIYIGYNEVALAKIMKYTKEKMISTLIIFDDMLGNLPATDPPLLKYLISSYRHIGKGISIMVAMQKPKAVSPLFRDSATYAVMFRQGADESVEALYKSYGIGFKNKEAFKEYLLRNTEDHAFVLYNTKSKTNDVNDMYSSHRCTAVIPKFFIKN